jgi:hypothetical protein
MVTGTVQDDQQIPGYDYVLVGDDNLLSTWLPQLARAGRYLYRALLPRPHGQPLSDEDQGERLRAALQPGTIVQVNPVLGVVTIPWALLYERELKFVPGRTRVCEHFVDHDPASGDCLCDTSPDVVCPYAFWGYRYAIEQIPCWVSPKLSSPELVRRIHNDRPLYLNLNVWKEFLLWRDHIPKIKAAGEVEVLLAEEIPQLEQVWQEHSPCLDIIYFYSHGGADEIMGQPYLELSDGRIDSIFLEASRLEWQHHPLVLLNGCATGDYGPESYVSLIEDFRAAGASGVIGTECPVPELFAEAYAAALLPRVFRRERLGQAMLEVRLEFLRKKKNLLGLVYTLFAAHEIVLKQPVAEP